MGVTLEVWRARIGGFNNHGSCNVSVSVTGVFQRLGTLLVSLVLINILLMIGCVELNPGPTIHCVHCNEEFHTVTSYGRHQEVHMTDKNSSFPCYACEAHFKTVKAFQTHHTRFHSQNYCDSNLDSVFVDVLQNESFVCTEAICQQSLRTAQELRKHMVMHLRSGCVIMCPFQPCENKFTKVSTFRTHVAQYHRTHNEVITGNVTFPVSFSDNEDEHGESNLESDHEDDELDMEEEFYDTQEHFNDVDEDQNYECFPEYLVREHVGKFYLKLEGELLLPTATVQRISEEISVLCRMSQSRIKGALHAELARAGFDRDKAEEVITAALQKDVVHAMHQKGMDVSDMTSDHLRRKFFHGKCAMLSPEEVPLGPNDTGKQRYAHYIKVKDTLELMFCDPTVQEQIEESFKQQGSTSDTYVDICDGSTFKEHPICGNIPWIQIILFQDAFEFYAISPSSGLYKCVGFYFTLGNIHHSNRSKVDSIQLVFLVKESDLKYFTPEKVLEKLISELRDLSENGIDFKGKKVPVVVTHMCGDNLGQNYIGKYIECFTGNYYCRFCEVTKSDILKKPDITLPLRTPEEYDKLASEVVALIEETNDQKKSIKGIKGSSVFNTIPFFHVCNPGQPPCIGHDILEGVAKKDLALCLKYFIEVKGWISFQTLDRRIKAFKCQGHDGADSMVPLEPALLKIRGHASEVWLFTRMLPFLIIDKIQDKDDPVWQLCLQLKVICEYVFAPEISPVQVTKLKVLISLYVEKRASLFQKSLIPKHHFMCHYPELITCFGPLIRLWTMRFESRHVFFKRAGKAANNFKNITYTLAHKYTLNFAYKFTGQLFGPPVTFLHQDIITLSGDNLKPSVLKLLGNEISTSTYLKCVSVHGTKYHPGLWLVLGSHGKDLIVGEILLIVYDGREVKFILKSHQALNTFQGYYIIQEDNNFIIQKQVELPDYYPLAAYEHEGSMCLTLKHSNPSMDVN